VYPNAVVDKLPFRNVDFFIKKIQRNPFFFEDRRKYDKDDVQDRYIFNIIQNFYGYEAVEKNYVQPNGKTDFIPVCQRGIVDMLDRLELIILTLLRKDKHVFPFGKYNDENYIALCELLIYCNLIFNNFDDDLDAKFTTLSSKRRNELKEKVMKEDMNCFTMINEKDKTKNSHRKPETLEDKLKIISSIRNSIAHSTLNIRFTEKNIVLSFGYENIKFKKNIIVLEDFLEFIMRPLFVDYKPYEHNMWQLDTFEDLLKKVSK
jgi:hypothetical protein